MFRHQDPKHGFKRFDKDSDNISFSFFFLLCVEVQWYLSWSLVSPLDRNEKVVGWN